MIPFRMERLLRSLAHPIKEYEVTQAKNDHRKKHPSCAVCGRGKSFFGRKNDVHHLEPVHVCPERSADPENLVTLCRVHHFIVGHLGDWRAWNDHVIECIQILADQLAYAKEHWKRYVKEGVSA